MAKDCVTQIKIDVTRPSLIDKDTEPVLFLTTGKSNGGGIVSSATVFWVGPATRQHIFSGSYGDYSKPVHTNRTARATQKAINAQHALAFNPTQIKLTTIDVIAHYAALNASR